MHAFAPGDHVWLGGIRIPHARRLAGHSDADVILHALVDAVLGALAMAVLMNSIYAEALGMHSAWIGEHHFLEEYSHSPAPEVFLGAASQRTKNIRLGHGIVQLTTNPPQRVARLKLLARIVAVMGQVADFSKIEG